jgi:sulfur relay (sulfurtransferase) complex TusBCD TusD component (DsrE family)
MDARGLGEDEVLEGCRRGSLQDLESLVLEADKVLVF